MTTAIDTPLIDLETIDPGPLPLAPRRILPPATASSDGTSVLTLDGDLADITHLYVDAAEISFTQVDDSTVTFTAPAHAVDHIASVSVVRGSEDVTLADAFIYAAFPGEPTINLIPYGNSFTSGSGASPSTNGYAYLLQAAVVARGWACSTVFGYAGVSATTMLGVEGNAGLPGTIVDDITPLTKTADINVLYFQEGTNDCSDGTSRTAAQLYANFQAVAALGRAAGCLVVLATTPLASAFTSPEVAAIEGCNQLLRANWRTFCDGLLDQAAILPDPMSSDFAVDHLHPSNTGHAKIFAALDPIVQALANRVPDFRVTTVLPAQADAAGGTPLRVFGIGFKTGASAKINGVALGSQSLVSGGEIAGTAPAATAGQYSIEVDNPNEPTKGQTIQIYTQIDPRTLSTPCKLWLRASRLITPESGSLRDKAFIKAWGDGSGNSNNFAQSSANSDPTWRLKGINDQPALHFQPQGSGGVYDGYFLGPSFASLTAAHMFCVLAPNWGGTFPMDPWRFGSFADQEYYPYADGTLYLGWGSTGRKATGVTMPTVPHILEIISTSSEWTMRFNGVQVYTTASNTVGFEAAGSLLGADSGGGVTPNSYWNGMIGEMTIFNAKLSSGDQSAMVAGLSKLYGIYAP